MGEILDIKTALIGTDKEPGFFERVRNLEDWVATQKKAYWFIGTIFAGDLFIRILDFLNKNP